MKGSAVEKLKKEVTTIGFLIPQNSTIYSMVISSYTIYAMQLQPVLVS